MKTRLAFLASVCLLLSGRETTAQIVLTVPPGANLSNPGARALALGGAVTGLADDASATELNPAGITQIPRDEISLEYRQHRNVVDNRYPNTQEAAAPAFPVDPRNFPCLDSSLAGGPTGSSCGSTASSWSRDLAFGSIVLHSRSGLSFGLYRHEIDNENLSYVTSTLGVQAPLDNSDHVVGVFNSGNIVNFQRRIDRTGLAIAYKISPVFSVGASVNENSLSYTSRFVSQVNSDSLGASNRSQGPPYGASLGATLQSGNENRFGYTEGLVVTPTPTLQIGAALSSEVRYKITETDIRCEGTQGPSTGSGCPVLSPGQIADPNSLYSQDQHTTFLTLPSKYSIGLAFRPSHFNILLEGDRVLYSQNNTHSSISHGTNELVTLQKADDIWELRAGVEWLPFVSPSGSAFAIRAGYYREPDHLTRTSCSNCGSDAFESALSELYRDASPQKQTTNHVSAGFGIVWAWGQVDVGYDRASNLHADTLSATLVIRP